MVFFEKVELAPPDPILGIGVAFNNDPRGQKINLGIGTFKDADLNPYVLETVKEAEKRLLIQNISKDYLPIEGERAFLPLVKELSFGSNDPSIMAVQTVGGTGALRLGAEFLKKYDYHYIYIPDPSWDNHQRIFHHAAFEVGKYPYYNPSTRSFDCGAMIATLKRIPSRSVILLQACCHNPTGFDPTFEEWKEIALVMKERELLPYFDFAYQGFGRGLEPDAEAIRYFVSQRIECLVAASYSKNFGLYAERLGALFVLCGTEERAKKVESQVKIIVRGLYSNPPCHGARVVATILGDKALRKEWETELNAMRFRIVEMRKALTLALEIRLGEKDKRFEFMKQQIGMFSYTGLSEKAAEKLIAEHAIYVPKDGRINVAGLNTENIEVVADAIVKVA
jgi:aspartate/tyrosine/aromatic aminotransferase